MSVPTTTSQWILSNPGDKIVLDGPDSTFKLKHDVPLPELQDGQVLVQVQYLSNDPAQRTWIWQDFPEERHYEKPVRKGDVMRVTRGIGKVIATKAENLPTGTVVLAQTGWARDVVLDGKTCIALKEVPGLGVSHYLGAFGTTGLTAMFGLLDIGRATGNDIVAVSGAAGATGSIVVQLAKHVLGCKRVIGIAGGKEKCKWVESLGADVCVDYKAASFREDLFKATEQNPTVYFDNVGGEILDLMLTRIARRGRIVACGAVSSYDHAGDPQKGDFAGIKNWMQIIANRLEIKGFIIHDVGDKRLEYVRKLISYAMEGKLKLSDKSETVIDTKFEDIPKTWMILFSGGNTGKLITRLE